MIVVVSVISPAPAWVMPRRFVDQLRRDFPQHTFLDAWDRDALRRLLPSADAAFTPVKTPVSVEYLTREGLSPTFVKYMQGWKGFVEEPQTEPA